MTPAPLAIPRFTYDFPGGKLDNFGHWLVDCLPHVLALSTIDPQATFLLPAPVKRFQRALLSLVGVTDSQMLPWNGEPIESSRLLVLESDGRIGGGRPLSSLMHLRSLVAAPEAVPGERPRRRIYVSRRDAAARRSWIANEREVEALFHDRGFDVLVMSECPLEEQVRLFRSAAVVAGISGAGLADIVFAPAGTHVMVLTTDSLIRWYAKPGRGRAKWANDAGAKETNLAAFGDSPRFYAHLAAACEQVCHSFMSGDHVPLDALAAFVDEVLAQ
jgi:capsular polysaccharide biosynthesis protein